MLKDLYLNCNQLKSIPEEFLSELRGLRYLELKRNQLGNMLNYFSMYCVSYDKPSLYGNFNTSGNSKRICQIKQFTDEIDKGMQRGLIMEEI